MRRPPRLVRSVLLVVLAAGCASPAVEYRHNRVDYWALRARVGLLPEPSYLPFVSHWERLPDGEDALVFCRWPNAAFPLRYSIEPPVIPEAVQNEFRSRSPAEYVAAVERAFRRWEREIGRPVRFLSAEDPARADLRVRFDTAVHEAEEGRLGGMAQPDRDHCRIVGRGRSPEHVQIEYGVTEVALFIVDDFGLLTPGQVQRIALHEIGHVLGASGQHSPLRGDVMFRITDDSQVEVLSQHDVATFRALYKIEPGTIYTRLRRPRTRPVIEARRNPPRVEGEVRDERFDFRVQLPVGWQRMQTPRGWLAVDGVTWDYDASIQLIALRGTLEGYLTRLARGGAPGDELRAGERVEVDGTPMARVVKRGRERTEETSVLDWAEGWILLVLADCGSRNYDFYRPWFLRVVLSLDHLALTPGEGGAGRPPDEVP